MSLQEIVVMIHNGEYGRAISWLEGEASDESKSPTQRVEACRWIADCYMKLEDPKESGDWYLKAVRMVLSEKVGNRVKAEKALPLCEKALESYKRGGDTADVLVASRLKQYLRGLA
jgi:hypothetical protein